MSRRFFPSLLGIFALLTATRLLAQSGKVSVVSATSSAAGFAPGSLGTIFGSNLCHCNSKGDLDESGAFPTQMAGVTVDIKGERAQLLFVSDTQINFVVPEDLEAGSVMLTVHTSDGGSLSVSITVNLAAPGIFVLGGDRPDRGAVLNAVTFQLEPFSAQTSQNGGSDKRTRLALFGSGVRFAGNPKHDKGMQNVAANLSSQLRSKATGRVWDLEVEFAGSANMPGLDQINVVVPADIETSGTFEITISVGGVASNMVTVVFEFSGAGGASLAALTAPASITVGTTATGSVSLSGPAPGGGAQVQLVSSSSDLQTPASVTIPAGQTSASFAIAASFVSNAESITLRASFNGVTQSATTTITPLPCVASVSLSSNAVVGGAGLTGTVKLTAPAPNGGLVVNLQSNNAVVQVPASVTIPAGQTSVSFPLTTGATSGSVPVILTATFNGCGAATASVTVNPAVCVQSLSLSAGSVAGGTGLSGSVTLSGPAPIGGVVVSLQSSSSAAQPGSSVTVPAGQTSASFNVTTTAVSTNTSAAITASIGGCAPLTDTVIITGQLCVAAVSLSAGSTIGGSTLAGTVTLTAPAPSGGVVVTLQSNNALAIADASVTIPAGQTSAGFNVRTLATPVAAQATIFAALAGCSPAQVTMTVSPPLCVASLSLSASTVNGGQDLTGKVTLTAPAPSGGVLVRLQSSDSHVTVPASVTVAAGQTSISFKISTKSADSDNAIQATISANTDGCGDSATLTVKQS
jgi:uncharacterized protein (TIGR03437 family)